MFRLCSFNLRPLLTLSLVLSLGACSFKKNPDEPEAPAQQGDVLQKLEERQKEQADKGQLSEENVSVTFEEADYGYYRLKVLWPKNLYRVEVFVDDKGPFYRTGQQNYELENSVLDGSHHTIKIRSLDQLGSPISAIELQRTAPLDIVVGQDVTLQAGVEKTVNRLVFRKSSRLVLAGYNFNVTTNKLIIEDSPNSDLDSEYKKSNIVTNETRSAISTADLKGSSISITAKKAIGTLKIAMVGVDGPNGRSGVQLESEKGISNLRDPNLDGVNGNDSVFSIPLPNLSCMNSQTEECIKSRGAKATCNAEPTDGTDGKNGPDGLAGEDGWNGGNTGNLYIEVNDDSQFNLEVYQRQGKPGKGAEGAPGHYGGIGGKAGKNSDICDYKAKDGKNGINGNKGANGKDGTPGAVTAPSVFGVSRIKGLAI